MRIAEQTKKSLGKNLLLCINNLLICLVNLFLLPIALIRPYLNSKVAL